MAQRYDFNYIILIQCVPICAQRWPKARFISFQYSVYFNVVQTVMHYYISYKGQGESITSSSQSR